jgi:sugar lactone lactonase YvrE
MNLQTAAAAIVCAGYSSAPLQAVEQPIFHSRGVNSRGEMRLDVHLAALADLRQGSGVLQVELPIAPNERLSLNLNRFNVVGPETRFVRAGPKGATIAPAPDVILMRGEVVGEIGSHAFLALTGQGAGTGFISRGGAPSLQILTDRVDGKASGLIVRQRLGGLPALDDFCAIIDPGSDEPAIAGGPPEENRGLRVLTAAVDADQSYTELFASDDEALAYIVQVIGAVSDIYMRDLGFKVRLGFVRIWPDGGEPFSADNISGFRSHWQDNEDMTGLNLVHMFSGRRDLPYGGVAYLVNGCSDSAFGISGFMLGGFPAPIDQPDLDNWDVNVVSHEMGHNMGTPHTHDFRPPADTCAGGTEERGTIMSYCHTRMGGLLNIDMRFHVVTIDEIINDNPADSCLWHDCNGNDADDAVDVLVGASADLNGNGIPDECEDCNDNGILDPADIAGGIPDLNANGIPDPCEADCNGNGQPDRWETAMNLAPDQNGNRIPDECEPDCDGNGIADFADIHAGTYTDLDRDSVPDPCQDCNRNGLPDWIDIDRQFNVYVAQTSSAVREYHAASGVLVQEFSGALANDVYDVTFGSDRQLYLTHLSGDRVLRINVDTGTSTAFVPAGGGGLDAPSALTFGPDGHLYVASLSASSVLKFDGQTGAPLGLFVSPGSGSLSAPYDLVFGPDGDLYVSSSGNNQVLQYDGDDGTFINAFVNALHGSLSDPRGLAFLSDGVLLVANRAANNVTRHNALGQFIGVFNDEYPLSQPWGIMVGSNGNVYIASTTSAVRLIEYDVSDGRYIRSFVRGDSGLVTPTAFAFRPASPNDLNANNLPDECEVTPCIADIASSKGSGTDGIVDVTDLLLVISSWGPCSGCVADIAPAGGDGEVAIDDLLEVIQSWGPCL